jgi:hypothetical protein
MNSTTNTPTPVRDTLYFNKKVIIFVEEKYSFKTFKKHGIKRRTDETDEAFNNRCVKVWNLMCLLSNKDGVYNIEDEEIDDDNHQHDCEGDIEEIVEEAIEIADETK